MAGLRILVPTIEVRILVPQLKLPSATAGGSFFLAFPSRKPNADAGVAPIARAGYAWPDVCLIFEAANRETEHLIADDAVQCMVAHVQDAEPGAPRIEL